MVIKGMSVNEYTIGKNLNANDVVEVDLIKNIISALKENQLFSQIKYIDLSKKYNILLMYGDLITIELGNGENLDKKIENTKLVIEMNGDIKRAVINAKNYQKVKYREVVE